jgi:Spy/CpxP family protein refolding chaperone
MKKRNWIIGSILAGTIGIAGVAHACSGPGGHFRGVHGGDRMMHVMKTLDLTTEQRQAIRKIKNESRDQMEVKRDEMFEIRKALREQGSAETYDAAKVRELADAKAKIMTDMTVQRFKTMHQIRKELTAEQLKELDEIKDRRFERRGF